MTIQDDVIDAIKHIIAKGVTVGATVFIMNDGFNTVYKFVYGSDPNGVGITLLALVTSYKIWTDAIVPIVDGFFQKVVTPSKAVPFAPKTLGSYSKLI